jgi:membrane protein
VFANLHLPVGPLEILKRTVQASFMKDDVLGMSAQLAYYFFFSLFPALLFLISIATFFPVSNLMDEVVRTLGQVAPPDIIKFLMEQIQQLSESRRGGFLTVAFLITIWTSSTAMVSVVSTINRAYDIQDTRPWWKIRITAIALTIGLALFILTSFTLVIAGPQLAEHVAAWFGLGAAFEWTWKIAQWPVVLALVITAVGLVYYFAADAEQEWVWITPGAITATAFWLAASLGVRYYVTNFGNYNETYGAVGGVMILLLWFYVSGMCLLIGAEMNAEIEHASPHGKAPGEKAPGERKKIGVLAAREYEERIRRGEHPGTATAATLPNCTLDRPAEREPLVRPSEVLVGGLALAPAILALGARLQRLWNRRAGA